MSAELAFQIGHGVGADGKALFENGSFAQYMAHGASQGIVSMMRGQKFEHGFVSGLVGKIGGGVAESYYPGVGMGNMLGKASVIGLFGGIASEAVGGDFYEGAVEAAFVYLYNDVWDQYASKIAFGDDANDPKLELSDEFIQKTNSKFGDHVILVSTNKHNLTVLDVSLVKNQAITINGKVGHATLPNVGLIKNFKSFKTFKIGFKGGLGFNTFEGNAGGSINIFDIIKINAGVRGALGGLSAKGEASFQFSKGLKVDILLVPFVGAGGYIDASW